MSSTPAITIGTILDKADLLLDHKRNNVPLTFDFLTDGGLIQFSHAVIDEGEATYYYGHIDDEATYNEVNDTFTLTLKSEQDSEVTKTFIVRAVCCNSMGKALVVFNRPSTRTTRVATGVTLLALTSAVPTLFDAAADDELLTFVTDDGITLKHLHGSDDEIINVSLDIGLSYDAAQGHFVLETDEREYHLIPYKDVDLANAALADEDLTQLCKLLDRLAGNC